MTPVAVTQRVTIDAEHGERRDALDQRLANLLKACGVAPVPVPNIGEAIVDWIEAVPIGGVLLSGGNDLVGLGGDAPERDETEETLVNVALSRGWPVVGLCRGMQLLAYIHGATLVQQPGHVGRDHAVVGTINQTVNSYHRWCLEDAPPGFATLARAYDGTVEAMAHSQLRLLGLMWHPERDEVPSRSDIELLGQAFHLALAET